MKKIKLSNVRKTTLVWFVIVLMLVVKKAVNYVNHGPNDESDFVGVYALVYTFISIVQQLRHGE